MKSGRRGWNEWLCLLKSQDTVNLRPKGVVKSQDVRANIVTLDLHARVVFVLLVD